MVSTLLCFVGIRLTIAPTSVCGSLPTTQHATRRVPQRASRGPVLMLDIGGVLHPGQPSTLIYLSPPEIWLQTHPDVDVVISSD